MRRQVQRSEGRRGMAVPVLAEEEFRNLESDLRQDDALRGDGLMVLVMVVDDPAPPAGYMDVATNILDALVQYRLCIVREW